MLRKRWTIEVREHQKDHIGLGVEDTPKSEGVTVMVTIELMFVPRGC